MCIFHPVDLYRSVRTLCLDYSVSESMQCQAQEMSCKLQLKPKFKPSQNGVISFICFTFTTGRLTALAIWHKYYLKIWDFRKQILRLNIAFSCPAECPKKHDKISHWSKRMLSYNINLAWKYIFVRRSSSYLDENRLIWINFNPKIDKWSHPL